MKAVSQINTYFQWDLVRSIEKYVNMTIREWEILWLFHKNPFLTFSIRDIVYSPIHCRLSASSRQGKGIAWQWGFWNPKKRLSLLNYQLFPSEYKHAIWSNSFSSFRKAPCVTLQGVICNMAGCYQAATIFYLCSIKSSIILRFIHPKTFHGRHTPIPVHVYHGYLLTKGNGEAAQNNYLPASLTWFNPTCLTCAIRQKWIKVTFHSSRTWVTDLGLSAFAHPFGDSISAQLPRPRVPAFLPWGQCMTNGVWFVCCSCLGIFFCCSNCCWFGG